MNENKSLAIYGGQPVRETLLVFGAPDIQQRDIDEVADVLRSGWLGTGPRVSQFEHEFAQYIGCKNAVAVDSCTAALELALESAAIGAGHEVITTPMTFCSTANVIVRRGAKPVFVDVDDATGLMNPGRLEKAITAKTRAVIPVHLYGQPCNMTSITEIAESKGIRVIEDAAHSIETWHEGKKVGRIGDATAFSFYVTKNLVTGEGGMLTTERDDWAGAARVNRLHGLSKDAWARYSDVGFLPYDVVSAGKKCNMTDIQAALGVQQLNRLEENLAVREAHWESYDRGLSSLRGVRIPKWESSPDDTGDRKTRHARHLYTIRVSEAEIGMSRWEFVQALKAENIGTGIHFLPLHLHTFYRDLLGHKEGDFPIAEAIGASTVSLPLSSALLSRDIDDVVTAVRKVVGS